MITRPLFEQMPAANLFGVHAQLLRQNIHDHQADGMRGLRVSREQRFVLHDHAGPFSAHFVVIHDHIVLAHVEKLGRVGSFVLVDSGLADFLVSDDAPQQFSKWKYTRKRKTGLGEKVRYLTRITPC